MKKGARPKKSEGICFRKGEIRVEVGKEEGTSFTLYIFKKNPNFFRQESVMKMIAKVSNDLRREEGHQTRSSDLLSMNHPDK